MRKLRIYTAIAALAFCLGLALAAPVQAGGLSATLKVTTEQASALAAAKGKAVDYLRKAQRDDGGFNGGEFTAWIVMALALAGEDPGGGAWEKGGVNPVRYVEMNPGSITKTTDFARLLLAAAAAGKNVTDFGGRDLIANLLACQNDQGHFGREMEANLVNSQAWSIIALSLANRQVPQPEDTRDWLIKAQNDDGGWGVGVGSGSDPDNTAAAVIALRTLGVEPSDLSLKKAQDYFRRTQLNDGGFGYQATVGNTASDALALLALMAMGQNPLAGDWNSKGRGLLGHLFSLQNSDGSFQWQPGVIANPEWMTAQALIALAGIHPVSSAVPFKDVPDTHFAAPAIRSLAQRGVLSGYPDGTFKPENPVTRAEFAKIVVAFLGEQDEASQTMEQFSDLKREHWANRFIKLALDKGLMRGKGEGRFDPEGRITGAEVMAVLARASGLADTSVEKRGPNWYSVYVELADKQGWLYPNFQPLAPSTRAQVAYSVASCFK